MNRVTTMLVVSRVAHYRHADAWHAYTPYAREIDIWADLFPRIVIAGTLHHGTPPDDCAPLTRSNVEVWPVWNATGHGLRLRARQAVQLPVVLGQLAAYMRRADAIQVRCPGDLGLLGVLLAPLFSRRLYAKYATQWLAFPGEPLAWRLQRAVLRSRWWRGPVTVYGAWPDQPGHVVPFFTSVLTNDQVARARAKVAAGKQWATDLRVLFVGRLSRSKNVDVLLDAIAQARRRNVIVTATIIGEGPERATLEAQARLLGIAGAVRFAGGLAFDQVLTAYERSDVLVLVSDLEGWPKAIAEGMTFGLVCVGADRGIVPQMLGEGRGWIVPPRDPAALAAALERIDRDRPASVLMARRAADWAQQHSLEGLRSALRDLLTERWAEQP